VPATISIFADEPRPSSATTVTVIGATMPRPNVVATDFLDVGARVPRDRDRAIGAADREHIERRIEAAAVDEVADELAETLLIELAHAGMVAARTNGGPVPVWRGGMALKELGEATPVFGRVKGERFFSASLAGFFALSHVFDGPLR
jgi:hypothetical protein